jgi:glycosyltransferase involved in cell wall biosynthesis
VTPSYNQGQFLRRTIESVLTQDYPHIDYRVVDGASTDGSLDILRSYGKRVCWESEKDRGQTHAINKGMEKAKGDILAYLNSDDVLRPGAVSKVVAHFRERPACDLVYGQDAFIDEEDRYLGLYPTAPYSFERLAEWCCISQPAAFWRRRIAELAGPFDEALSCVMDYEYWLRIDRLGGVIEYLPEVLASTRMHTQSKTNGGLDTSFRRYAELVPCLLKHTGSISPTYGEGLFREYLVPRWPVLARFPTLTKEIGNRWFVYRVHHRCRAHGALFRTLLPIPSDSVQYLARSLGDWLLKKPPPGEPPRTWAKFFKLLIGKGPPKPRRPWAQVDHCPVTYLGPVTKLPPVTGAGEWFLTGRAVCDTRLSVQAGGRPLVEVDLKAGEMAEVRIPRPAEGADGPIILRFSDTVRCAVRGEHALQLYGTNLFRERDVV